MSFADYGYVNHDDFIYLTGYAEKEFDDEEQNDVDGDGDDYDEEDSE